MKNIDNERKTEKYINIREENNINYILNCKSNEYIRKNNEIKSKHMINKWKYYDNKKNSNNVANNLNLNTNTIENKMTTFKKVTEREERRIFSNLYVLKDKNEYNDNKSNNAEGIALEVRDNLILNEKKKYKDNKIKKENNENKSKRKKKKKKKEEMINNLITTHVQDIEINNLKKKNIFQIIEIYGSENKFMNSYDNEIKQNINNNTNNENTNTIITNNLNNENNDFKNININNEMYKKNNLKNKNNSSISSNNGNQCMNNDYVNFDSKEVYYIPFNIFNNNENKEQKEWNKPNDRKKMNITNISKTEECEIKHEHNEELSVISDNSFSVKNNLEVENTLKVDDEIENTANENISNENNIINNTQNDYFANTYNENEIQNNSIRSRISNENGSNNEELDYYVLTITNIRNNNENENNEVLMPLDERHFISKLLGYEMKPNLEEFNINKIIRLSLFILFLIILFTIEFVLLYKNMLKLKIDNKLILVEANYNNIFLTNFLFQFDENELNNLILTENTIKEEIDKGNFMLYNNMCVILKKLNTTCINSLDYYKEDNENKKKLYESTKKVHAELHKKDIIVYRAKESIFTRCNDISTRNLKNNDNYIFLFVNSKKYLKISKLFFIITLIFFCIRIALILSRIIYELILLSFYRNYKLSLSCRRKYLSKYIWSVCTILILEVILGDDCIIWWLHDVDPLFNYHFQFFIWFISLICILSNLIYKLLKKYSETHNNEFTSISFSFKFLHEFLFGANILFACIFILSNVHKPTIIIIIMTIIVLLIDILNDAYAHQVQTIDSQTQEYNMRNIKKFYIIENKKKNVDKLTLARINEHIYKEIASSSINKEKDKNSDIDSYKNDNTNWITKKTKAFSLKKLFNKKYFKKKKDLKKNMYNKNNNSDNNNITFNKNKLNDSNASILDYCEICDERIKNVVLYPCMHGGFCETCIRSMILNSLKTKDSFPHCPFCRDKIQSVYKISYEDSNKEVQANTILTIKTK